MYCILYLGFTLVFWVSTTVASQAGYHEEFGIPAAKRIKNWEDRFFTNEYGNRIVGGSLAPSNTYPFFGGLLIDVLSNSQSVCGSSLLTANRLVTAAHCWWDGRKQASKFTVILGTPYLYHGGLRIETNRVVVHPQFSPYAMKNDIAVIYLPNSVGFGANIAPIDLPRGQELLNDFLGMWAVAIGFGKTSEFEERGSSLLSHVNLQVMPVDQCHRAINAVSETNICTGGAGRVGICHGDSGGPLVTFLNGRQVLIGISVMVSVRGCDVSLPSAYSRITSYYLFITQNM